MTREERIRLSHLDIREYDDIVNHCSSNIFVTDGKGKIIYANDAAERALNCPAAKLMSMNWMHFGVFNNNPPFLEKMGLAMQEAGVKPEVEVFDAGMIYEALYYLKKGILKAPVHFQFCM